jgi:hypothetical protein
LLDICNTKKQYFLLLRKVDCAKRRKEVMDSYQVIDRSDMSFLQNPNEELETTSNNFASQFIHNVVDFFKS